MLVALSVEDTVSLRVDVRIFTTPFCNNFVFIVIPVPFPYSNCCPFEFQVMVLPTAVQVNSATALMEALTARGGMVISAIQLYIR